MRKKKVFDDGATLIESVEQTTAETTAKKKIARRTVKKSTTKIDVCDIITATFSYLPTRMTIMENTGEKGQCVLCGKETTNPMRKICFECYMERAKELYDKSKDAIGGEDSLYVEVDT